VDGNPLRHDGGVIFWQASDWLLRVCTTPFTFVVAKPTKMANATNTSISIVESTMAMMARVRPVVSVFGVERRARMPHTKPTGAKNSPPISATLAIIFTGSLGAGGAGTCDMVSP
jgi:hypothetical protein